jgi:RNA polymerase sigma-70 factor (ECF subfamily)
MTNYHLSAPSTSSSLLRRVREHDQDAWRRLSDLYGPVIYNWCRRAGLQPADASDATQDVFRGVMTGIAQLRHGQPGDSFRGWLSAITRYKVQDHFRSRRSAARCISASAALARNKRPRHSNWPQTSKRHPTPLRPRNS